MQVWMICHEVSLSKTKAARIIHNARFPSNP